MHIEILDQGNIELLHMYIFNLYILIIYIYIYIYNVDYMRAVLVASRL